MRTKSIRWACIEGFASMLLLPLAVHAGGFSVLYNFQGGNDGSSPAARLMADQSGNLYGTTEYGGGKGCGNYGCGTLFKLAPDGTETVLYAFTGGSDGAYPIAGLTADLAGNLYGTASGGGQPGCIYEEGCGTAFELAAGGTFVVLHSFTGGSDGANPTTLIKGTHGSHIGAATFGGNKSCYQYGCGIVYRLTRNGTEKVLHTFAGDDGELPAGLASIAGKLYGGTADGGDYGDGVIYKLARTGKQTVIHSFNGSDGWGPGSLIADAAGNFYGPAVWGGNGCEQIDEGCGTIFKLAPDETVTVLHGFTGATDGGLPNDGLVSDSRGNLYGTTDLGGDDADCAVAGGCGVVFKLAPDGSFDVLHTFVDSDGAAPAAGLLKGPDGYLYGTTSRGGGTSCQNGGLTGCGVVFKIKK